MKPLIKNIVWGLATLVALALIFSLAFDGLKSLEKISLDQVALKINAGEVEKIEVAGDELKIGLKDGSEAISKKEAEVGLSETLSNYGVLPEKMQAVTLEVTEPGGFKFWASIILPSLLPLAVIIFIFWWLFRNAKSGMNQAFSFGQSNLKSFTSFKDKVTFKDVAGLKEAKQELEEVVEFLKQPKKFSDLGAKIPRGVLLVGAPGTGKTLLARSVAGEAGVPFFHMSASEFVEMFVGVGASRTRDAFERAKKAAPSILFIDEIDAIGRQRGAGLGGGHDEREQTLNQILVEMDGFDRDTRVIVLAATNRPDVLDAALLRPGRFDRRVVLSMPDIGEREAILKIHAQDKKLAMGIDLKKVAVRTPGFTGADLANLMNEAAILAARNEQTEVSQQNIFDSIEKVILGPERKSRIVSGQEKEIVAYHEAGHALVASSIKEADPVHKISIIPRNFSGGHTLNLPEEERFLRSRGQLLAYITTLLGGMAAEAVVFKETSTGPANDLKKAYEIARKMVTEYGMSEELGPVAFNDGEEAVFLGREIMTDKHYSEETAKKIDAEVGGMIKNSLEKAKKILTTKRKVLDTIAKTLLEKEILEREDFQVILNKFKVRAV